MWNTGNNVACTTDTLPFIAEPENKLDLEIDYGTMIHEKVLKSAFNFQIPSLSLPCCP